MFDELTRREYLEGCCHILALALHRKYDLPLVALLGEEGGEEIVVHVACEHPNDWTKIIDIEGVRSRKETEDAWYDVREAYWEDITEDWIAQEIEEDNLIDFDEDLLAEAEAVADRLMGHLRASDPKI